MHRRLILTGGSLLGLGIALPSRSQTTPQLDQIKPYLQVKPIPGEEKTVRVFFSPACQYSKMYLHFFRNLSSSLPEDKRLLYTPLVNKGDGVSFAMAFAAVQRYYPAYIDNFIEVSMIGAQDKGISTSNWVGIERMGLATKLPVSLPKLVRDNSLRVMKDVELYVSVRHNLQVINTPAVAVAGTYVVTPEFTKGDAALFSQLVNGIISMAR